MICLTCIHNIHRKVNMGWPVVKNACSLDGAVLDVLECSCYEKKVERVVDEEKVEVKEEVLPVQQAPQDVLGKQVEGKGPDVADGVREEVLQKRRGNPNWLRRKG